MSLNSPSLILESRRFTPVARTRTRTSSSRTSGSGTSARRSAPCFLYLSTTNAFMAFSDLRLVAVSGVEERRRLPHEIGVVLENAAMPGVLVDRQLSARDTAGHVDAVRRRDHDVVVAIRDQHRDPNA